MIYYHNQTLHGQQVRFCLGTIIDIIYEDDLIFDKFVTNEPLFDEKYIKDTQNKIIYSFTNRSTLPNDYSIGIIIDAFLAVHILLLRAYAEIMIRAHHIWDDNKIALIKF